MVDLFSMSFEDIGSMPSDMLRFLVTARVFGFRSAFVDFSDSGYPDGRFF